MSALNDFSESHNLSIEEIFLTLAILNKLTGVTAIRRRYYNEELFREDCRGNYISIFPDTIDESFQNMWQELTNL